MTTLDFTLSVLIVMKMEMVLAVYKTLSPRTQRRPKTAIAMVLAITLMHFPMMRLRLSTLNSDSTGNNADLDDDGDGFSDEEEAIDGTNPLSRFSCESGCFSFDVDLEAPL